MTSDSKRGHASSGPAQKPAPKRRQSLSDLLSMDPERQSRLLLIAGAAVVVVIAAGFIAFGYWQTKIKPEHRTVLAVDGVKVDYAAMKRRMLYDLNTNSSYLQSQQAVSVLPQISYQELVDEIVVVNQGPSDQGIEVTDQEFDQALRTKIGVAQDANADTFANALRKALQSSGLHEDEYRRVVRADLIKTKITDKMTAALPATMSQAKVDVMQFKSKDTANQALLRVRSGEDWATVAKDLASDTSNSASSSQDYAPKDLMSTVFSEFAFSANNGAISDLLTSGATGSETYGFVHLIDRADKPLTDAQKPQEAQAQYTTWLTGLQAKANVTNNWDQQSQNDALISVLNSFTPPTAVAPVTIPTTAPGTPEANQTPATGDTPAAGANPQSDSTGTNPGAPNATAAAGGGSAP